MSGSIGLPERAGVCAPISGGAAVGRNPVLQAGVQIPATYIGRAERCKKRKRAVPVSLVRLTKKRGGIATSECRSAIFHMTGREPALLND
jgi:hypothetical protein